MLACRPRLEHRAGGSCVYAIFDGTELIYLGMAGGNGKGSLTRRLVDHSDGQVVNIIGQYVSLDRILPCPTLWAPRVKGGPLLGGVRCRS